MDSGSNAHMHTLTQTPPPPLAPSCLTSDVIDERHQHAHVALVLLGPHPVVQHNGQGQEQVEDVALAPPKAAGEQGREGAQGGGLR